MKDLCKNMDEIDESSLIGAELDQPDNKAIQAAEERYTRANKESYKKHYGKTKA
jgi:hypothetical protein